jgi:hypothetical protein
MGDINAGVRNTLACKSVTKCVNIKQISYALNSCILWSADFVKRERSVQEVWFKLAAP